MNLVLTLKGQVKGGKNNIIVTRSGMRFPKPAFTKWKIDAMRQIAEQLPIDFEPISSREVNYVFEYTPDSMLRRDAPAILDGLCHAFEKSGVVKDDCLVKHFRFDELPPNKEAPGCVIRISF